MARHAQLTAQLDRFRRPEPDCVHKRVLPVQLDQRLPMITVPVGINLCRYSYVFEYVTFSLGTTVREEKISFAHLSSLRSIAKF